MTQPQVAPHDLDAEAAVLSTLMICADDADKLQDLLDDGLKPDHFYSEANRRIFVAVLDLAAKGLQPDPTAVMGALRDVDRLRQIGGSPYLLQLVDATPATMAVEQHARKITSCWKLRETIRLAQLIAAEGYSEQATRDPEAWLEGVEQRWADLLGPMATGGTVNLPSYRQLMAGLMERIQSHAANPPDEDEPLGAPMGIAPLNERYGGARPGWLIVVAGRPGMGKTAIAQQFWEAAADSVFSLLAGDLAGKRGWVAVFSGEMTQDELGERSLVQNALVPLRALESARMSPAEWERVADTADRMARLPIYVDDRSRPSIPRIRQTLRHTQRKVAKEGGCPALRMIVIDYLQIMERHTHHQGRPDMELGDITSALKALAKEYHCPVVLLSQVKRLGGRPGADKRPTLEDLKESGAIEQDADVVLLLHREDYYKQDNYDGAVELITAKARKAQPGVDVMAWDGPTFRVHEPTGCSQLGLPDADDGYLP